MIDPMNPPKNITPPTRAALQWRQSRNSKAVEVLGLVNHFLMFLGPYGQPHVERSYVLSL